MRPKGFPQNNPPLIVTGVPLLGQSPVADGKGGVAWGSPPASGRVLVYRDTDGTPVNNSTTLVNDDVLKFDIGANEIWQGDCRFFWKSTTGSTQLVGTFSGPAAASLVRLYSTDSDIDNTTEADNNNGVGFDLALPWVNWTGIGGVTTFDQLSFFIINGANAGVVNFEIAQASAVAEDTLLLAGSHLIANRLA